jgi:hypothetical protein
MFSPQLSVRLKSSQSGFIRPILNVWGFAWFANIDKMIVLVAKDEDNSLAYIKGAQVKTIEILWWSTNANGYAKVDIFNCRPIQGHFSIK